MKKKGIDLSSIDTVKGANEGFDVQIYHPGTNEDLGVTINILGKDSDEFLKVSRAQSKKRMAKMTKGGGFRNVQIPIEEVERDGLELLAACTKSWSGVIENGKVIECNKDNAIDLYERYPWVKEQVDTAMGDRANFIKGLSKPSSDSENTNLL
jgi:hypothetical protein